MMRSDSSVANPVPVSAERDWNRATSSESPVKHKGTRCDAVDQHGDGNDRKKDDECSHGTTRAGLSTGEYTAAPFGAIQLQLPSHTTQQPTCFPAGSWGAVVSGNALLKPPTTRNESSRRSDGGEHATGDDRRLELSPKSAERRMKPLRIWRASCTIVVPSCTF